MPPPHRSESRPRRRKLSPRLFVHKPSPLAQEGQRSVDNSGGDGQDGHTDLTLSVAVSDISRARLHGEDDQLWRTFMRIDKLKRWVRFIVWAKSNAAPVIIVLLAPQGIFFPPWRREFMARLSVRVDARWDGWDRKSCQWEVGLSLGKVLSLDWDEHTVVGSLDGVTRCTGLGLAIYWAERGFPDGRDEVAASRDEASEGQLGEDEDSPTDDDLEGDYAAAPYTCGSMYGDIAGEGEVRVDVGEGDDDVAVEEHMVSNEGNGATVKDVPDGDGRATVHDRIEGANMPEMDQVIQGDNAGSDEHTTDGYQSGLVFREHSVVRQLMKQFLESEEENCPRCAGKSQKMCAMDVSRT